MTARWAGIVRQRCPEAAGTIALPFTLRVDEAPGRERFAVVFSAADLDEQTLGAAVDAQRRDGKGWVTRFDLEKEVAP